MTRGAGFGRLGLRPVPPVAEERAEEIAGEVAEAHGISLRTMRDRAQFTYIVTARRAAARRIAAELPMLPPSAIGRVIGLRHRTSVTHYLETEGRGAAS